MHVAWLAFLASAAALAVLIGLLAWEPAEERPTAPLVIYCAAAIKAPVEAAAREYLARYGVQIQHQYGAPETLLLHARLSQQGDLYLPADDGYLRLAEEKELLREVLPLAHMTLVVAVRKGSPKQIQSLRDLL